MHPVSYYSPYLGTDLQWQAPRLHIRMNLALPMEKVVIAMDRLKEYVFI